MRLTAVQINVIPFAMSLDGSTWIQSEPSVWPVGEPARVTRFLDSDGEDMKKLSRSLSDLRNDVMLPVRALVHNKKSVTSLKKQLETLLAFEAKVARCVERCERNAPDP